MIQTHWRLAFMFDAPAGDLAGLESGLLQAREAIGIAAGGNAVRLGVAIRDDKAQSGHDSHDMSGWRSVDGAVEVTIPNGGEAAVPDICRAMRPILDGLAEPGTIEVMTGAMFPMVPMRTGDVFLSLAFRRGPGTTVGQFRDWWLNQHSQVAIPVLGPGLLAYDQVHVDTPASRAAAAALNVPFVDYDAYDNLTWGDQHEQLASTSDAEGMVRIAEDEVGRIDNTTRRHALMRALG